MRKGFTLVAAVFIILAVTLFTLIVSSLIMSESQIAVKNYQSLNAFYIANAGYEYALNILSKDDDWSSNSPPVFAGQDFSGGHFDITYTSNTVNRITLNITGIITVEGQTFRRALRARIMRNGAWSFADDFAVYMGGTGGTSGDGTTNILNDTTINGGIFSGSNLVLDNNTVIDGNVTSTGNVTGNTSGVTGDIENNAPPPDAVPSIDTAYYDNLLATAATYPAGGRTYSGTTVFSGTTYINGDVDFQNDAIVSVNGSATLIVSGKVSAKNNLSVGNNFTLIAGDEVSMKNTPIIGESGLWYSSVGIDVENNSATAGSVGTGTSFMSPGYINAGNNMNYNGLVFCEGTLTVGNNTNFDGNIFAGFLDVIGNNSTITVNSSLTNFDAIPGLESNFTGTEVVEVGTWDEIY